MRRCFAILLAAVLVSGAGTPLLFAAQAQPTPAARPATEDYVFPPGAGLLFFYVRRDKTAEFETIMARVVQALAASTDPLRRQQAAAWQTFRSVEPNAENPVYLFLFNPAVAGADYDPVKMLSEAVPSEAPALYEQLKAAVIRVERMALMRLR